MGSRTRTTSTTSAQSLVFLEDHEAPFRAQYGRVLVYDLKDKTLRTVARVDPTPRIAPGAWEATGVINAQTLLGNNWWLVNVQAHNQSAPQPSPAGDAADAEHGDGRGRAVARPLHPEQLTARPKGASAARGSLPRRRL